MGSPPHSQVSPEVLMDYIERALGPALVGIFVTLILYGIMVDQTYTYYQQYPKDRSWNKLLVGLVGVMDTVNVVALSHAAYYYLVAHFGQSNPFPPTSWTLALGLLTNVILAFMVQLYFTKKIHEVSEKNWWMTGTVAILVGGHCTFGLANTVSLFIDRNAGFVNSLTLTTAIPWAGFGVTSDVAISGSLCWLFHKRKERLSQPSNLLNTFMTYAINRCILTCAAAILEIILFVSIPSSLSFLAVDLVLGKLYSNSLLASLNSRRPSHWPDESGTSVMITAVGPFSTFIGSIPPETEGGLSSSRDER